MLDLEPGREDGTRGTGGDGWRRDLPAGLWFVAGKWLVENFIVLEGRTPTAPQIQTSINLRLWLKGEIQYPVAVAVLVQEQFSVDAPKLG